MVRVKGGVHRNCVNWVWAGVGLRTLGWSRTGYFFGVWWNGVMYM